MNETGSFVGILVIAIFLALMVPFIMFANRISKALKEINNLINDSSGTLDISGDLFNFSKLSDDEIRIFGHKLNEIKEQGKTSVFQIEVYEHLSKGFFALSRVAGRSKFLYLHFLFLCLCSGIIPLLIVLIVIKGGQNSAKEVLRISESSVN